MVGESLTRDSALQYWALRPCTIITKKLISDDRKTSNATQFASKLEYINKEYTKKASFLENFELVPFTESNNARHNTDIEDLQFWSLYMSFSYCPKCYKLFYEPLKSNFGKRYKAKRKCSCNSKCVSPTLQYFPDHCLHLKPEHCRLLSPFNISVGRYSRSAEYRQKTNIFRLQWKPSSVLNSINDLSARQDRLVLQMFISLF